MSAGPKCVYHSLLFVWSERRVNVSLDYTWIDHSRKQVKLPAPTYIDYVMTWLQNLLDDETVFPTKSGT
jgi:Mob1/phocein family